MANCSDPNAREALTSRTLPLMTLSTASNPLTAPLHSLDPSLSRQERALKRFAVDGNAVITGGAGMLALTAARALLEHGAWGLALLDLEQTLEFSGEAIGTLIRDYPQCLIVRIPVNVTDPARVQEAMERAHNKLGSVDMLLCFAGVVGVVPSLNASPASDWQRLLDVNVTGSFLCAQAAARMMLKGPVKAQGNRGGSIVFISSISGHNVNWPQPQCAYNVSKAGVLHLTRNLAVEWAQHGIRVNSISPGYMDTILNAGDSLQGVRDVWASRCPMGRMGDVEELNGVVVMLCSQRAGRYISGADILVDGGATCF